MNILLGILAVIGGLFAVVVILGLIGSWLLTSGGGNPFE